MSRLPRTLSQRPKPTRRVVEVVPMKAISHRPKKVRFPQLQVEKVLLRLECGHTLTSVAGTHPQPTEVKCSACVAPPRPRRKK